MNPGRLYEKRECYLCAVRTPWFKNCSPSRDWSRSACRARGTTQARSSSLEAIVGIAWELFGLTQGFWTSNQSCLLLLKKMSFYVNHKNDFSVIILALGKFSHFMKFFLDHARCIVSNFYMNSCELVGYAWDLMTKYCGSLHLKHLPTLIWLAWQNMKRLHCNNALLLPKKSFSSF